MNLEATTSNSSKKNEYEMAYNPSIMIQVEAYKQTCRVLHVRVVSYLGRVKICQPKPDPLTSRFLSG